MDESLIQTDYVALDKREPVRRVRGWLQGETSRRPLVLDGKRPFAIVSPRAFLTRGAQENTRLDKILTPVPVARPQDDAAQTLAKMAKAGVTYLPVANEHGHCVGYVDALTLLRELGPAPPAPTAADLMGEAPPLFEDGHAEDAIQLFARQHADVLRVIDGRSQTVGTIDRATINRIVQESDTRMGRRDFAGNSSPLRRQALRSMVQNGLIEVPDNAPYDDVLDILERDGSVFVRRGNGIAGIVTPLSAIRTLHEWTVRQQSIAAR